MSDDALRLLARRDGRALARLDALASAGSPAIMGRVTTSSAAPGAFFKLQPQVVAGGECEGCDATFADAASLGLVAYNLGPATLASGDKVVARFVASRWVAGRKAGGSGGPPSGCGCTGLPSVVRWTRQLTNPFTGITYVSVTTMTYAATNTVGCGSLGAGWLGPLDAFPAAATAPGPPWDPPVTERYVFMQFYCTGTTLPAAGFRLRFVTGSGSTLPCTASGEWVYTLDPVFTRNTCSPFFLIDRATGANLGVITG